MAIDLTPDQRELGMANYARTAEGLSRRGFMKSLAAGAGAAAIVTPAAYFGYHSLEGRPVRAALIGGGDEGGVLVGEHNPEFIEFVAVCDIRPSNMKRIFDGDPRVPLRTGFRKKYGAHCDKKVLGGHFIEKFDDYDKLMEKLKTDKSIEALVIALPLSWHARAAIDAMRIGQERGKPIHVLCEKLMAWNIQQCKQMIQVARETGSVLSIGHQRHYSMLYAHAVEIMNAGVLGEVKHIRALWHRNNTWPFQADPAVTLAAGVTQPVFRDGWFNAISQEDYEALNGRVRQYGYDSVEQLIRWRLYNETGGGLMAELGSHQLDACSIFLGKVHPISVSGVGLKSFYGSLADAADGKTARRGNEREVDDHVFVTYEFPGKHYAQDKNDVVVVTYSSISTNQFEAYGECVMGTRGTMIVEGERSVMLFSERDPNKKGPDAKAMAVGVSTTGAGKPALESSSTWGGPAAGPTPTAGPAGAAGTTVSRGYREEMEDFAYCIRIWEQGLGYKKDDAGKYVQRLPRCHGEVAMADAIVALAANRAMKNRERIEFKESWFQSESPDVPDADAKPKVPIA